jgi:RNA polymerase sigma-70 factor (ECF subfamily)
VRFEHWVEQRAAGLRAALVAAYGIDVGVEATADALAYGFQHWDRVGAMDNPAGYLYRVGQSAARRQFRRPPLLPASASAGLPAFEPGLAPALASLTEVQRSAVVMVHALGWPIVDVADLLGVDESTVRTHIRRALDKLRAALEVTLDAR